MCYQNSCELVLKDVCSFLTLADSWAYAIPYRGIIQEFLKLPEHTKEVIEGLVELATDKSAKEETNKAITIHTC